MTGPGAAFRVVLRDDDLVRVDADGSERRLTATPAEEEHVRLSPDGARLAYVRDNNLFALDLATGLERQLTADGSETILNGAPSWIYMEEILGRGSNAFWWSPDGTRLAFMRFDDAPVPVFPIYHADGQHGTLERTRYPKPGDPNPYVRIGVVAIADGKTTWMDFEEKADHYLAFPKWSVDGRTLFVQWMNRGQDTLKIFACDAASGKAASIHQETQRTWVDWYEDLTPLADGSLLFISDVDGWRHLYRYAKGEPAVKQLTHGAWRVHQILKVAGDAGLVYFSGRPVKSWDTQLMRLKLAGGEPEIVTKDPGRAPGVGQPGRRLRRRQLDDARPRRRASCSGAATARWCARSRTRRRRPASTASRGAAPSCSRSRRATASSSCRPTGSCRPTSRRSASIRSSSRSTAAPTRARCTTPGRRWARTTGRSAA